MQLPTNDLLQNLSLKKNSGRLYKFQDNTEISGHSAQILKFQEFQEIQDNAQVCEPKHYVLHCMNTLSKLEISM